MRGGRDLEIAYRSLQVKEKNGAENSLFDSMQIYLNHPCFRFNIMREEHIVS